MVVELISVVSVDWPGSVVDATGVLSASVLWPLSKVEVSVDDSWIVLESSVNAKPVL